MSVLSVLSVSFVPSLAERRDNPESLSAPTNIGHLLLRAAHFSPDARIRSVNAGTEDSAPLSYPSLLEDARRISGGLAASGCRPGSAVALCLERPHDFLPAFWGCVLGGYVPCPLAPLRADSERSAQHLAQISTLLDRPLFVTTRAAGIELPEQAISAEISSLRRGVPRDAAHEAREHDLAILMLTSGSTGHAKAVELTHGNLLASLADRAARQRLSAADTMFNWIAFDHVAALLESHMIASYVGANQIHTEPATILADPLRFLRIIGRYQVTIAFAPNFLLGQINAALSAVDMQGGTTEVASLDLSCLRRIVTGGEANVVTTGRRFLDLLAPYGLSPDALWPAFGMTETCAACIYSHEFPHIDTECEFASVGIPVGRLNVRIVDADGCALPPGQEGELQLSGPMIFARYHNNEEATRAAFTADGWLRTGDLARIQKGRLSIVGRSKDCVIVSGVNYFSHELEATLEQLEGIERSFVAAFPTRPKGADTESLVVAFATTFDLEDDRRLYQLVVAVRNTTIMLWGFRPAVILPLPRSAFPKTSLGKIRRSLMRKRLEAGEWSGHLTYLDGVTTRQLGPYLPPDNEAEAAIARIFAEILGLDPARVSATASFFDLGGTSLDIIKLKQKLAERLQRFDFPIVSILQHPTPRALAGQKQGEYDPVVVLQATGDKTPLFCIHPATGEVLVFVSLANYFVNHRPFYALRARGFSPGEKQFESIDEMVSTYVAAIRTRQPRGPYAIAGYSFGAPIAFEVAKALEAQNERVAFCGSIDGTVFIGDREHKLNEIESAFRVAYFLGLVDMQQMLELPQRLGARMHAVDPYKAVMELACPTRLAELDLDVEKFTAWAKLSFRLVTLGQEYIPSGSVESATVFYAEPLWGTKDDWLCNKLVEWNNHTRTPPRYVDVPGSHSSLLERQHVASFQMTLRAELDRSLNGL
jgi:acyl-CoA synthetase (AMP-forming)/AMP-acid ligase II/thioesterase domain-containing protein